MSPGGMGPGTPGVIDPNGSGTGTPGSGRPSGEPGVDDLRRLSPAHYEATLRSLFGDGPVDEVGSLFSQLPDDRGVHEFAAMERGITSAHVDAYFTIAKTLADNVSQNPSRRGSIHACLAGGAPDRDCVSTALETWGRKAFRRPVTPAEREALLATFDSGLAQLTFEDGFALVLLAMLQSPAFLYHVEVGAGEDAVDAFELSNDELANRLSYTLTGAPPDDALLAIAVAGGLADEGTYRSEVERLTAGASAEGHIANFFTEWLRLDRIPVPQHSAEFLDGVDGSALAEETQGELLSLVSHHVLEGALDYRAMLTTGLGVPSENLSAVYGVAEGSLTDLSGAGRAGLLTRPAFLLTAGETTHPIQRGVFIMRTLLCEDIEIPPPSAGLMIEPPPNDPTRTARQRWTDQTSEPSCAGCHTRINPFGFALERYDALGRYRDVDNGQPIDDAVEVFLDGAPVSVQGASELADAMSRSSQAPACLAKKWFRFNFGRRETAADVTAMVELAQTSGVPVMEVLSAIVQRPEFRLRTMEGSQ